MFNVIDQYNSFVENNFIKKNKDQIEFLKQADSVWSSSVSVSYTHLTLPTTEAV